MTAPNVTAPAAGKALALPRLIRPAWPRKVDRSTPARARPASERLTRMLYAGLGITAVVFGALSVDTYFAQAWAPAPARSMAAWLLFFGIPIMIGALSTWAPLGVLRGMAVAESILYFGIVAFWLTTRAEPLPAGADIPWVLGYIAGPAMAVAIALSGWIGWIHMVVVCVASGFLRAATSSDPNPPLAGVQDSLYALLLLSVFVCLFNVTRHSAARVDAAEIVANADVAERAAHVARTHERLTIDALVHDGVISTLLMAGHGRVPTRVLSRHAGDTLIRLDALRAPIPDRLITGSEVARRLQQIASELAPDASIRSNLEDDLEVPSVAVTALLGAVGEALRNSEAAAGAGHVGAVVRTVIVQAKAGGIRVEVLDDGVGFDLGAVPPERLGIAESIIGRMERVAGGSAAVRSWPGAGTEVVVAWAP